MVTPREGIPTGIAEVREPPGAAEVCEPSPTITTAGSRSLFAAAVFLACLEEGSAASLRFFGALLTTSMSPEVIRSEILVTAEHEKELVRIQEGQTKR